jgi:signal transduction histidine kinase
MATTTLSDPMEGERRTSPDKRFEAGLRMFSSAVALAVATVGLLAFCGWLFGIDSLKTPFGPRIAIKTNATLCLMFSGVSLWLLLPSNTRPARRGVGQVLGLLVLAIGSLTLSEHIFRWDPGIDQALFREPPGALATMSPNRMGPPGSLSFALVGLGILLLDRSSPKMRCPSQYCAIPVVLLALLPILGYSFGEAGLYGIARVTGIALLNAASLLGLGLAMICGRPESSVASLFCRPDNGGLLARRLLLPAILLPFVTGAMIARGISLGYYDGEFAVSMMALVLIGALGLHIWRTCEAAGRLDEERRQATQALQKAQDELTQTNKDLDLLVQQRTAKLKDTLAELEYFSYTITHDLRAPLGHMQGFVDLVKEQCAEHLGEEAKDYLRRINAASERMAALITNALNYTKLTRQEMALEPIDAAGLLRDIIDTYPNLHPSNARIRIEGEIPKVIGNAPGLTQCFSNLLGNAVKFVERGKMPEIRIRAERRDGFVRLWFEDNGIGIPNEAQSRVFEMFHREDSAYEGTGIGLALVRKVATQMGGKVGVDSEPTKGSRFWLELNEVV